RPSAVQDHQRSATHSPGELAAAYEPRRIAAALQRGEGRYVAGWSAAADYVGSRFVRSASLCAVRREAGDYRPVASERAEYDHRLRASSGARNAIHPGLVIARRYWDSLSNRR